MMESSELSWSMIYIQLGGLVGAYKYETPHQLVATETFWMKVEHL